MVISLLLFPGTTVWRPLLPALSGPLRALPWADLVGIQLPPGWVRRWRRAHLGLGLSLREADAGGVLTRRWVLTHRTSLGIDSAWAGDCVIGSGW